MRDQWTDKLPSLMEGFEEAPPEGLWDAVQAGVTRPKVVWWPWAASMAAAAAVVLAVFLWKPSLKAPAPEASVPATMLPDVPRELLADIPEVMIPLAPEEPVSFTKAQKSAPRSLESQVLYTETPASEVKADVPEVNAEVPQVQHEPRPQPETSEPAPEMPVIWPQEPEVRGRKAGRVQLTVTSGGALLAQAGSNTSQGYGVPSTPGMQASTLTISPRGISPQLLSRNRPSSTVATHRQLIRVSLGVNYEFAPRWSVGSGLSYSILRSDYTTVSGTTETRSVRHLHYLGVPLNLQFNLLEWKRLSLYVYAGPMLEAAVGANVKTTSFVSEVMVSQQTERLIPKDWRWSLNAGAGAQLQLFRNGSLFVQPGISWHIPGNSSVESFYTAHSLAFSFDFGFRFTL